MQCYTELTPPTGVTHSLYIALTSSRSSNLVVAKSSLLQVFATKTVATDLDAQADASSTGQASYAPAAAYDNRINNDDGDGLEASFLGGDSALLRSDKGVLTKLVLVAEFKLAGTVTGLARIKIGGTKSGGDALLLAFKDARLSLVEWDPESNDLSTISIHYYEQDELQGAPWAAPLGDYANFLVADPGSRCAALRFGARNLAILPFRQPDEEEDIDMDDDWDEELDGPRPAKDAAAAVVTGAGAPIEDTPFAPSFVLRLSNLDPNLLHPVHLSFLHEYREPTFGILSSSTRPSTVLGRRDCLSYIVFTLDLQQKASTTILSVANLPQDLFRVFPVPSPIGGALLLGTNELIHIDQSGRANGVAVNPFTKQSTSFGLADQSDLDLRLEGSNIEVLSPETGELLLVLNDGRIAVVTLVVDGRVVSGVTIKVVSQEAGGDILLSGVASLTRVGRQALFAGSEDSDSIILGWSRKQSENTRRKQKSGDEPFDDAQEDGELEDEEDDDDLYGDGPSTINLSASIGSGGSGKGSGDLSFRVHDRLISIAPIRDMTFGTPPLAGEGSKSDADNQKKIRSDLSLVCAVGRGKGGALALLNREISPEPIGTFDFAEARALWTVCASKPIPKTLQGEKGGATVGDDYESPAQYDKFMIVATEDEEGFERSDVYAVTGTGFEKLTGTEFEPEAGSTVHAGTMGKHKRIIQVLKSEVRCYDGDLGLSQILPMVDEDTGAEPKILSASITDKYLLVIRDDASAFVAEMNKDFELEEIEREDETLSSTKWATGCLYNDTTGAFSDNINGSDNILMFLLSEAGQFHIYSVPSLKQLYVADGLCYTPPLLSADYTARRGTTKEELTELLVADLGDTVSKSPYLILRHANDDLTIYQPIRPNTAAASDQSAKSLRFLKIPNIAFAKASPEDTASPPAQDGESPAARSMPLRAFDSIGGYSTVFLPGASPSFVLKSAKSSPKVLNLQGTAVRSLSSFHTQGSERGFIYVDVKGASRVCSLPTNTNFAELGVCVRKVPLNVDANTVAYHPPSQVYAVGASTLVDFELPKDDTHRAEWAKENITFKPQVEQGQLQLISPVSWTVIDTAEMEQFEVIMCVKTLNLEVSEATNERKQLVTVGTAISRGEDLAIRGRVYVFDVVTVIPEPGRPETNRKLKLVAKEDIPRGAVTALSEIGTQGLMLVAQGQKCLVRGLKEDGTLLPVAFMDMNCYVTSVKELPGTGLCVMADAFKGVWFTGYTEEPYKMILFGKSNTRLGAINVDLLPDGKELFIVATDGEGNLHVLQFDPEHPKSLQGHLLLHRATFCTGAHFATSSILLPSTSPHDDGVNGASATNGLANGNGHENGDSEENGNGNGMQVDADDEHQAGHPPPQHLLFASPTGVLASMAPLSESEYRRLSSLAAQLTTTLTHTAGLNPKGYRLAAGAADDAAIDAPGVDAAVGRSVVDGAMLARWAELGSGRKSEIAGRVGFASALDVRAALEGVLGWSRMSYF